MARELTVAAVAVIQRGDLQHWDLRLQHPPLPAPEWPAKYREVSLRVGSESPWQLMAQLAESNVVFLQIGSGGLL